MMANREASGLLDHPRPAELFDPGICAIIAHEYDRIAISLPGSDGVGNVAHVPPVAFDPKDIGCTLPVINGELAWPGVPSINFERRFR